MTDQQAARWPRLKALRYVLANWLLFPVIWVAPDDIIAIDKIAKIARHNADQAKRLLNAD